MNKNINIKEFAINEFKKVLKESDEELNNKLYIGESNLLDKPVRVYSITILKENINEELFNNLGEYYISEDTIDEGPVFYVRKNINHIEAYIISSKE